jgi:hypothetical protein
MGRSVYESGDQVKLSLLRVYVKNPADGRTYRALLTPKQAKQLDNGRLVSCGLTVGEDGLGPPGVQVTLRAAGRWGVPMVTLILKRDGVKVFSGSFLDVLRYIHRTHCYSLSWACRYEGYRLEDEAGAPIETV